MGRKLSYGMAINEALHQMMRRFRNHKGNLGEMAEPHQGYGIIGVRNSGFILRGRCVRVKASTGNHVCGLFRGLL